MKNFAPAIDKQIRNRFAFNFAKRSPTQAITTITKVLEQKNMPTTNQNSGQNQRCVNEYAASKNLDTK